MDFNDEDRTPINFEKTRRTVNKNHLSIIGCIILLIALVILLVMFVFLDGSETVDSSKVEIQLDYSDVKINDTLTCSVEDEAYNDAKNIKLSYKKSNERFYNGNIADLMNEDGTTKEVAFEDKIPGVDLVVEGITNKIYAYIEYATGDEDCDGAKYKFEDTTDGKIVIPFNSSTITNVSVYIYAADEECNKLIKNFSVKLPMYNKIFENEKCDSIEGKESAYCSEYSYSKYDESVLDKLGDVKKEPMKINIPAIVIVFVLFVAAGVVIYIKFN